jgi:hypothetical protein
MPPQRCISARWLASQITKITSETGLEFYWPKIVVSRGPSKTTRKSKGVRLITREFIEDSSKTIRKRAQASSSGPMESTISEIGGMGRDMATECGPIKLETAIMANGSKAKAKELESTSPRVPTDIYR